MKKQRRTRESAELLHASGTDRETTCRFSETGHYYSFHASSNRYIFHRWRFQKTTENLCFYAFCMPGCERDIMSFYVHELYLFRIIVWYQVWPSPFSMALQASSQPQSRSVCKVWTRKRNVTSPKVLKRSSTSLLLVWTSVTSRSHCLHLQVYGDSSFIVMTAHLPCIQLRIDKDLIVYVHMCACIE